MIAQISPTTPAIIDANGIGSQLAERAQALYPWKVQPVGFTPADKQPLAYGLHEDFKEARLRIPYDEKLRADLRGIKKEVTASERVRFVGETQDSHCDAKSARRSAGEQNI